MCVSYFMTGGPSKEHRGNRPPIRRVPEKSKGDVMHPTKLPESSLLESILAEQCQWSNGPPPGRTLNHNDWPETTGKLIPSP